MELVASLPLLVFFLASLLFCLLGLKIYTCSSAPGNQQPPGPWNLPFLGSLHHVLLSPYRDQPHRALRELSGRHGPLMLLRLGVVPALIVSSADGAREVLKTQDTAFASRHLSPTMEIFTCGGQDIFFAPYEDLWRQLRRICVLELFSTRRVMSFSRIREEEVGTLLRSVAEQDAGADVEIGALTSRVISDIVTRCTIGGRCPRRDEFLHEVSKSVKLSAGFNLADLYPSSKMARWISGGLRDAERCNRNMRAIMDDIIQERAPDADAGEEDLLGVLLRLHREGGPHGLTTEIITTVIVEVLGAGGEASWATLEWAMSELMRNPRVLHNAQAEVREMFQGRRQCSSRLADGDVLGRLTYLQLVIKETLRLHPPVPLLLPRQCREPCQLMGYPVPEGTRVLVNAWALGRDPAYWERAEEFEPERFEAAAAAMDFKGATNFEYIPFGGGKRMCPGVALSMANMELLLASLLYHFDWELPSGVRPEDIDMTEAFGITLQRKTKLVMRATLRIPIPT